MMFCKARQPSPVGMRWVEMCIRFHPFIAEDSGTRIRRAKSAGNVNLSIGSLEPWIPFKINHEDVLMTLYKIHRILVVKVFAKVSAEGSVDPL